jgi:hypothetical protein
VETWTNTPFLQRNEAVGHVGNEWGNRVGPPGSPQTCAPIHRRRTVVHTGVHACSALFHAARTRPRMIRVRSCT